MATERLIAVRRVVLVWEPEQKVAKLVCEHLVRRGKHRRIGAGVVIGASLLLLTGLIFSVATTIFNTALYVYANNNQVASGFDEDAVKGAFRQKN